MKPVIKAWFLTCFYTFLFLTAVVFSGCDDTITDKSVNDAVIPSSGVSFGAHILPVFTVKCNNSVCHDDSSPNSTLKLTNHYGVTRDPTIVVPLYPETSRLMWSIQHKSGALVMPPLGSPQLTENQINGIQTWIKEGAKNN